MLIREYFPAKIAWWSLGRKREIVFRILASWGEDCFGMDSPGAALAVHVVLKLQIESQLVGRGHPPGEIAHFFFRHELEVSG